MTTITPTLIRETEVLARSANPSLSANELCRQIGLARTSWTRYKAGEHSPTLETWTRARALVALHLKGTYTPTAFAKLNPDQLIDLSRWLDTRSAAVS